MPSLTVLSAAAAAAAVLMTGCCRPSGGAASRDVPVGVSTTPAVLADLKQHLAIGPEAVNGAVNEAGTGGVLAAGTPRGIMVAFGSAITGPYEVVDQLVVGPDGKRLAYLAVEGGKARVLVDGQAGPVVASVQNLSFSRDGRHVFYVAEVDGKSMLVIDGRPGPATAGFVGAPFQAAGSDDVVVVERPAAGGPCAVVTYSTAMVRRVLAEVGEAQEARPSPDLTRIAVASGGESAMRVSVHPLAGPAARQEGEVFELVRLISWDTSGTRLLYTAHRGDDLYLVLDGKAERLPPGDVVEPPLYVPGRQAVAVVQVEGDHARLHWAFSPAPAPDEIHASIADLTLSPDGRHLAYAAEGRGDRDARAYLVVDGKAAPETFDRVVSPRFSPDGSKVVYRARKEGQRFLVLAGADARLLRQFPAFEQVFVPAFTPDGTAVAYAVKVQNQLVWQVEKL